MGNGLREKWICNYDMFIFFSKISCIKESALSSWGEELLWCKVGSWGENCYDVDLIHEETLFVNLLVED